MYAFSERDGGWTTVREPVPRGLPTFAMKFQLVKKAEPASGGGGETGSSDPDDSDSDSGGGSSGGIEGFDFGKSMSVNH